MLLMEKSEFFENLRIGYIINASKDMRNIRKNRYKEKQEKMEELFLLVLKV